MKISMIGGRGLLNYEWVEEALNPFKNYCRLLISPNWGNGDRLGQMWAFKNNIPVYKTKEEVGAQERGQEYIEMADLIVIVGRKTTEGTGLELDKCLKSRKSIYFFDTRTKVQNDSSKFDYYNFTEEAKELYNKYKEYNHQ